MRNVSKLRDSVLDDAGRVGLARPPATFELPVVDYRDHLSPSLLWKWHLQDFIISSVEPISTSSLRLLFRPRYAAGFRVVALFNGRPPVLAALSSNRLSFIASIITAGVVLGKKKKDGEVIARDFYVKCKKPLIYGPDSVIPVEAHVRVLRKTEQYALFISNFTIGDHAEHEGTTRLLYCRPGLKGFSYL